MLRIYLRTQFNSRKSVRDWPIASGGDLQGDSLTSMDIDLFPIEKRRGPYERPKNGSVSLNIRIKISKFSLT